MKTEIMRIQKGKYKGWWRLSDRALNILYEEALKEESKETAESLRRKLNPNSKGE